MIENHSEVLRRCTGKSRREGRNLELQGRVTVLEVLKTLAARHGDELGEPKSHLQFLLNGRSLAMLGGFSSEITEDVTMMIFPPHQADSFASGGSLQVAFTCCPRLLFATQPYARFCF